MARQDFWNRQRGRERSWDVRDLREDYGQADYSRDYAFDRKRRVGYRAEAATGGRDDFGQADFSRDYEYDPNTRGGIRREDVREQLRDDRPREMRDHDRSPEMRDDHSRLRDMRGDHDDGRGYRRNESAFDRDRRFDSDGRPERRLDDPRTWFGGGHREPERVGRDDHYEVRDRDRHGRSRYGIDEQIWREVVERLETDRRLDARDVEVDVRGGEVTLRGMVEDRDQKRRAEDLADVSGVVDVHNHLTIRNRYEGRGSSWRRGFGLSG